MILTKYIAQRIRRCYYTSRAKKQAISYGNNLVVKYCDLNNNTIIGNDVKLNGLYVGGIGKLMIGNNTIISKGCHIFTSDHNYKNGILPFDRTTHLIGDVTIKDNVWIGYGVTILKGVTIEDNAIVGACSVVTKDIGKNEMWAGNPARLIKVREQ